MQDGLSQSYTEKFEIVFDSLTINLDKDVYDLHQHDIHAVVLLEESGSASSLHFSLNIAWRPVSRHLRRPVFAITRDDFNE